MGVFTSLPGLVTAPRVAARPAAAMRSVCMALACNVLAAAASLWAYMRAISIKAAPVRASSCCAAVWAAIAASAAAPNANAACIETSSAPAGTSPVIDVATAAWVATAAALMSTNCAPMAALAGSCDRDVMGRP